MKRYLLIILAVLVCAGCSSKKSLKVEDPAERAAMRTRHDTCTVGSAFSPKGLAIAFDVARQVKPKAFKKDMKEARAASAEEKPLAKIKDAFSTVQKEHSEEYNPGLTLYSMATILVFVILMIFKIIRAIFKND